MQEEIKAWLAAEERSYWRGVELYEKYGDNLTFVAQLRRHQTNGNFDALVYELSKLAEVPYVPIAEVPASDTFAAPAASAKPGESDLLREMLERRAALYRARAEKSDTLADLDGEELRKAHLEVVELDDQIIALSSQIRHVEVHGKLPEPPAIEEDLQELKTQRQRLAEKRSRARTAAQKNPDNLDHKSRLEQLDADIERLDFRIRQLSA